MKLSLPRWLMSMNDNGWGRKPGNNSGGGNNNGDGPPDLDKVWQDFSKKLSGIFGKKTTGNSGGNQGGNGGGGPGMPSISPRGMGATFGVLALVAALIWLASGFYILPEGQNAAILRFGQLKGITSQAGISWRMPSPIESHEIVNVAELRQVEVGYRQSVRRKEAKESLMLTNDQSILDLQFAAQYRIADPAMWLFQNRTEGSDQEVILRQAAESAMRSVVGRKDIDQVLYAEKDTVAKEALIEMQDIVNRYKLGVLIIDLTIQQAQPPEQVQAAFEDANKAAQDRERLINEGRAYANDVIPKAKGTAGRLGQEAEGYRQRIIATAEGDAARFKGVLVEYNKAPQVTRERMYIETMQQVFTNASKVYVDSRSNGGQGSLLYLPLDKLMQQANNAPIASGATVEGPATGTVPQAQKPSEVVIRPEPAPGQNSRPRDLRTR